MTHTFSHRHLVAAPLFALLLTTTFLGAQTMGQVAASLFDAPSEARQTVMLPLDKAKGHQLDNGDYELTKGSFLIGGYDLWKAHAGQVLIFGFSGGAYVSVDQDSVTVAALTSPAVIVDGMSVLAVPVGYQRKVPGGVLERVPPGFRAEQAKTLSDVMSALPVHASQGFTFKSLSFLQLPQTKDRLEGIDAEGKSEEVLSALAKGDEATALGIVSDPVFMVALGTLPQGYRNLSAMAGRANGYPSVQAKLVPELVKNDAATWLLLALHPAYAEAVWTAAMPDELPQGMLEQAVTYLPLSDSTEIAVSPLAVTKWSDALRTYLASRTDQRQVTEQLMQIIGPAVNRLETSGYPERAERYRAILGDVLGAEWKAEPEATTSAPVQEIVSASLSSEKAISPDEAEQMARDLLSDGKAGFTVNTKIVADGPGLVRVSSIMFASNTRDALYDFTLDPVAKRLTKIAQNGENQPLPLSWEAFLEWVRE